MPRTAWHLWTRRGTVLDFLSYERAFEATNGPAAGLTSVDIGVRQVSVVVCSSLQRGGSGCSATAFTFQALQANTFGAVNTGLSDV